MTEVQKVHPTSDKNAPIDQSKITKQNLQFGLYLMQQEKNGTW